MSVDRTADKDQPCSDQPILRQKASFGQLKGLWSPYLEEEDCKLSGDVLGCDLPEWDCLRVSGCIVHDHKNILVAPGRLWEKPYEVHTYLLNGTLITGRGMRGAGAGFLMRCVGTEITTGRSYRIKLQRLRSHTA